MLDHIFNLLGMTETSFLSSPKKTKGLVALHQPTEKDFSETLDPRKFSLKVTETLVSLALHPIMRNSCKFLNKGKPDPLSCILRPNLIAQMCENHIGYLELRLQFSTDPTA